MAPTTRPNSKLNTPVKNSTPAKDSSSTEGERTPTPSRKVPRCSKCQRPRAGHPRSGCPFTDNNTTDDDTATPVTNVTETLRSMIISKSDVLGASDDQETDADELDIVLAARPKARRSTSRRSLTGRPAPAEDFEIEDTKAVIRERRRSERAARKSPPKPVDLASLDSTSAELVSKLLIPRAEGTGEEAEKEAEGQQKLEKSVHWEDRAGNDGEGSSNGKRKDKKPRISMPCSFHDPSPYSSTASLQTEGATAPIDDKAAVIASISSQGSVTSVGSDLTPTAKPLSCTMSMEERHSFLEKLRQLSNVQVYVLNSADVNDIRPPKGLYTRLIPADDAHPEENILIVGKDEKETEKRYQMMKNEREASLRKDKRGSGGLKAATGGALVGAVAAFAGLAYT
uniref:Uncharacterized protein n=1 Tax=Moniliophthora roreri TaxID=221103 RepID=A0A0W0FTU2_MONRR